MITTMATANTTSTTGINNINILIKGLGHNIKLESINPSTITLDDLQSIIETRTKLPPSYQRLICNGKTLTSRTLTLAAGAGSSSNYDVSSPPLAQFGIGIQRRQQKKLKVGATTSSTSESSSFTSTSTSTTAKIILMHNSMYVQDKTTIDLIIQQSDKLESLQVQFDEMKINNKAKEGQQNGDDDDDDESTKLKTKYHHQITELCCKLDAIEIDTSKSTSASLRQMRKKVLHKADLLEKSINDYFS